MVFVDSFHVRTLLTRNNPYELKLKGLAFVRENQRNPRKLLVLLEGKDCSDLVCSV